VNKNEARLDNNIGRPTMVPAENPWFDKDVVALEEP